MNDVEHRISDDNRVGATIKALREVRGLSRRELATRIGKSDKLVGAIERGKRHATVPVRRDIVDAIGVPLSALTDDAICREHMDRLSHEVRPMGVSAA